MTTAVTGSRLIYQDSVADLVSSHIKDMILSGELQPGERIRLRQLAGSFGVSVMPVREALRQLQAEGLVTSDARRGARVAVLSQAEFIEVDHIVEELDVLAARWVAEDFGRLPLDQMRALLDELERAEMRRDVAGRLRLIREFRFCVYAAAHKPRLVLLLSNLYDMTTPYRRLFSSVEGIGRERFECYRAIYDACRACDLDALIDAIHHLFAFARNTILGELAKLERVTDSRTPASTGGVEG